MKSLRMLRLRRRPTLTRLEDRMTPVNVANIAVNDSSTDTTAQDTQSETSTIVFGNTVLASFNDSGKYSAGSSNHFTGWARSTDGGLTFTDFNVLPENNDAGDPVFARNNATGRIYLSTLDFNGTQIRVFRSDDNGVTWSNGVNGIPNGGSPSHDKEWMVVDNYAGPGQGNVYIVSRDFGNGGIWISRSTDNGATFGNTQKVTGTSGTTQGAWVTVAPDHSVHVSWLDGSAGLTSQKIITRKSTDQGLTFAPNVTITGLLASGVNGSLGLNFRTNCFPQMAANPVSGHLYVVYNDNPAGADRGDVFLRTSTDSGATWSAAIKVNDDTGTNDQWQPCVAVTPDGTKLIVSFYDRRNDPANSKIDYYGVPADISGGTVTFRANQRISNTSFPEVFGVDPVINTVYMGDYDTVNADNDFFYFVWADNRNASLKHAGNQADVRFAKTSVNAKGGEVISFTPNGIQTAPVTSAIINFNQGMDTTSFNVMDDIASFTGPSGDLKGQITGFAWNTNKQLQINFNAQSKTGGYNLVVGPNILTTGGVAMDDNLNGIAGEVADQLNIFFLFPAPRIVSSTPTGAQTGAVSMIDFVFSQAMDTGSFNFMDDLVSFTGPGGDLSSQLIGFSWQTATTLRVTFNTQPIPGAYSMKIGPNILSAGGSPLDQDLDGKLGEVPDDQYTAAFSIAPANGDLFGYVSIETTYDASLNITPTALNTITAISSNDDAFATIDLGTSKFRYYGVEYTGANQLFVNSNGLVTFGTGTSAYINGDLTSAPAERAFAAFWDDLHTGRNTATNDVVCFEFQDLDMNGTPERLVINWFNVRYFSGSTTSDNGITFQAVLELNTGARSGDLIVNYVDLDDGSGVGGSNGQNKGGSATVGIKDVGTQGGNRILVSQNNANNPLVADKKAIRFFINQAPTANAGGPYTVVQGGTVPLDGTKSSDPNQAANTLFYLWDLDGDGNFGEVGSSAKNGDEFGATPTFKSGTLPPGPVTVSLRVIDSAGATNTATGTVNVTAGSSAKVSDLDVNDGVTPQRSRVTSLKVTFDQAVTLPANPADAFQLDRQGGGAVALSAVQMGNEVVLTFTGGSVDNISLADGRYTLTILAAQVNGGAFDGNGDGTPGDNYVLIGSPANGLFRLFGDVDGNGTVNTTDFKAFQSAFGGSSLAFDFNNNGAVDVLDFTEFRVRFGSSI